MAIHPTAIVDKGAEVDSSAEIGAYAIVEEGVKIGADVTLHAHAFVGQGAKLGRGVQVFPFAVVSGPPQDLSWDGARSFVEVGRDTIIREHSSIHRGATLDSSTVIGERCFIMACAHVAHNCRLGDDVKLVNGVLLAGHVTVGDGAFFGGKAAVHQFVRIGELTMIGGLQHVPSDIPPFMMWTKRGLIGPNVVGLRRAGFDAQQRDELKQAHRLLCQSGTKFSEAVEHVEQSVKTEPGRRLAAFLSAPSKRGFAGVFRKSRSTAAVNEML